VNDELLVIQL